MLTCNLHAKRARCVQSKHFTVKMGLAQSKHFPRDEAGAHKPHTMPHTGERSEIEQLTTGPAMQREVSDAALPTTDQTVEETTTPESGQLASLPTGQADSSDDAARAVGSILTHGSSPGRLAARRVELPWAPDATCFTIENVLSDDECEQLIALSERRGYEQALVNVGNCRQVVMSDVRRSSRWMVADSLWRRIERHVPDIVEKSHRGKGATAGWYASGLNERLRFLKYNPGDYFAPHQDGSFEAKGQVSQMTVMLYLNSAGKGGETKFLNDWDGSKTVDVVPRRGLCLVFDHRLLHEGALLLKGVKYAVRTDVMFERRS